MKSLELKSDNAEAYINLGNVYKELGNLSRVIESVDRALALEPNSAKAYLLKGIASLEKGELSEAKDSLLCVTALNGRSSEAYKYLGILFYIKGDLGQSLKALEKALEIDANCKDSMVIKAVLEGLCRDGKAQGSIRGWFSNLLSSPREFPIELERHVEKNFVRELYELEGVDLARRDLPTKGNAKTSDFSFFERNQQLTDSLRRDLIDLAEKAIGTKVYFEDSWFTILRGGGYVTKHHHLSPLAKIPGLDVIGERQFALVYYLDIGDQCGDEPGFLEFYDPSYKLLPSEGKVVIFPAARYHSVKYNGVRDRVMVGVNFWST